MQTKMNKDEKQRHVIRIYLKSTTDAMYTFPNNIL